MKRRAYLQVFLATGPSKTIVCDIPPLLYASPISQEISSQESIEMEKQDESPYLPSVNNLALRETQTKGCETFSLPTYNEFRYSLPSPPDSDEELFDDDISTWSKEKVAKWIRSILKEVALYRYPSQQTLDLFIMDGKSLLYLSAEDLYQRDPDLGHLISEKLMDLQKKAYSSYSPDFYPLPTTDPNMWYDKPYGSCSPSESSDSEIDIPCTSMHGHTAYVPVASNCTPLGYTEALASCPGYINQILPPFNPVIQNCFSPPIYGSQTSLDEGAITIKKEPNFTSMHSPTGLYPEHHPYHQEHFPFSPVCRPLRPLGNHVPSPEHIKRQCLHVDPKGIEGIPKQAQLYEFILKVLNNPINQHIISWKDKSKGIFYINDTKAFARLWGLHRNSDNMSYEKLSRAMRYYYRRNILEQIKGRRLYKFTAQMSKQIMDE